MSGLITGKLQAEIVSVSGEQPALNFDFEEQQKEWVLTTDLPSGLYRVKRQVRSSP